MASLLKNVASQNVTYCMIVASSGAASTSTSTSAITAFVTKDGTQASAGGTFTYLGSGQWNYAPTQSETNCTDMGLFVTMTSNIPCNLDFHTDIVDANGFKSVNVVDIAGTTVSTTTGQLAVNVVAVNNVAATSVTAVNANIGMTQPVNFTGTGASALVKGDMVDIASAAVSTSVAQIGVGVISVGATALSSIADGLLNRDMSLGVDSGSTSVRTPRQALRFLRNKFTVSSGTLTVYAEDDSTTSWTGSVTSSSAALPITGNDPAGP
jgi:hypothetical protein